MTTMTMTMTMTMSMSMTTMTMTMTTMTMTIIVCRYNIEKRCKSYTQLLHRHCEMIKQVYNENSGLSLNVFTWIFNIVHIST